MTASRKNTPPFFDTETGLVDLAVLDRHSTRIEEYEALPDLSDIDPTADRPDGDVRALRNQGRPKGDGPKRRVIRFPIDCFAMRKSASLKRRAGW